MRKKIHLDAPARSAAHPGPPAPDQEVDVVVVGSGASGLAAALAAATAGASVTVIEKSPVFGGTSAVSGGSVWVPCNRYMAASGIVDSRDDALSYLRAVSLDRMGDSLLEAFVDNVNALIAFLPATTPLEFSVNSRHPDYQQRLPGSKPGGRTVQVDLYDSKRLHELQPLLRHGHSSVPVTRQEIDLWGEQTLDRWDWETIAERTRAGLVGGGTALIGGLLEGCSNAGVVLRASCRATQLLREGDRVSGVAIDDAFGKRPIRARRGVVLATGGFEWDGELVRAFLGVPMVAPGGVPTDEGDGLRMAMKLGVMLGNMTEAWWDPMLYQVGDEYDDMPLYRPTSGLRGLPGSIMVNRHGHRFVDEAMNYNDLTKAMLQFDPGAYTYANVPCYLVFDDRFRRSYSVGTVTPDAPTPPWMFVNEMLSGLSREMGIDPHGLDEQVRQFNAHAEHGEDPVFHRGENLYDRYRGDTRISPNPNVRPLGPGPYFGVELKLGCLGTKGGPVTDAAGQAVDPNGLPVPGLYACGNAAASPFGPGYPGAGATLAAGMTFGYLIGRHLGTERSASVPAGGPSALAS